MKLKSELWDKMQYLFRNYYDRMMHGVLYLENELDVEILKQSISIMLDKIPVLRSEYVPAKIKPYWKVVEGDQLDKVFEFVKSTNPSEDAEAFLLTAFDSNQTPQIRIKLFRKEGKDTLAFLVNHMCFDGADFKVFLYALAELYTDIASGGDGSLVEIKSGSRANSQVYSTMTPEKRKIAKGLYKNISKTKDLVAFPFTENMEQVKSMFVKHYISPQTFDKMRAYGKEYGATINDMVLAAYFRALYKIVNLNENQRITIPCMTDLRRHIDTNATEGFTNLTCLVPCTIDSIGPTFLATLKKVHGEMEHLKMDEFMGLASIPLLELAYRLFPAFLAEIVIKAGYVNPYIGMSNIGIIDDKKLIFNGIKSEDAFMTGAIKYKPYMQISFISFKKKLTLSIAIYGTQSDRAIIEKFFKFFDEEIEAVI